jgi:hypothetical protein
MMPDHRHIAPPIPRQSVTALFAPSRAAVPTASIVPLMTPKTSDTKTMIVQIHAIAIYRPFLSDKITACTSY